MIRLFPTTAVVTLVLGAGAVAAVPPLSAEARKKAATDIVVGKVQNVYTTERSERPGWSDRLYAIEVLPTAVEKGTAITPGKLIYARTWSPGKRPPQIVGHQGQNEIPKQGATVRLYLTRGKDGGFDLLTPNGVERASVK
jgi:hypothetical protein